MGQTLEDTVMASTRTTTTDELECKICYCPYTLSGRRPKVLECCHRLCAKCLVKILDLGESPPDAVVCPFCRYITDLPGEAVGSLPDDCNLVMALSLQVRNHRNLHDGSREILLSPRHLTSLVSPTAAAATASSLRGSNYVVITIVDPSPESHPDPQARPLASRGRSHHHHHQPLPFHNSHNPRASSLDSMASITRRWTVWNCAALLCQTSARALVWLLGLLYFSSLPLGVYLLIMQKTTLGVLLVSLVPASLLIVITYGLCQCLCHEVWDCAPP